MPNKISLQVTQGELAFIINSLAKLEEYLIDQLYIGSSEDDKQIKQNVKVGETLKAKFISQMPNSIHLI